MKKYLILLILLLFTDNFSQNTWARRGESIYFMNKDKGWITFLFKSTIMNVPFTIHTTDGGNSWMFHKFDNSNQYWIFFINDFIGFAMGLDNNYHDSIPPFYKTTDGGNTWQINPFGNHIIYDFYWFDENNGFGIEIISGNRYFCSTTDAGVTWDTLSRIGGDWGVIIEWVIDKNTIFMAPQYGGDWYTTMLRKSTDGGRTWRNIMRFVMGFEIASGIYGLCFADEKTGWFNFNANGPAADPNGKWKTTDGGETWFDNNNGNDGAGALWIDSVGFKVYGHNLNKTTDKGVTWDSIHPYDFKEWTFVDRFNGFAVKRYIENDTLKNIFCKTIDGGYTWSCSSIVFDTSAIITYLQEEQRTLVTTYILEQNYPNPFNPSTNIKFSLPEGGLTTIKVYDILGEEKVTLLNEYKSAGSYTATFDGKNLPSGVYIYTITSGSFKQSRKMLLMK